MNTDEMNKYYKHIKQNAIWFIVAGISITIVLAIYAREWVEAAIPIVKIGLLFGTWWFADKYLLKSKDTLYEIFDRKNVAAAILVGMFLIAVAIILNAI